MAAIPDTARPVCRCGHTAELHARAHFSACVSDGCPCSHYRPRVDDDVPADPLAGGLIFAEFAAATGATPADAARARRNACRRARRRDGLAS